MPLSLIHISIGIEGGRINVVPVDFIVAALDHIAHLENEDGNCFHLTDPTPMRVGDLLNTCLLYTSRCV